MRVTATLTEREIISCIFDSFAQRGITLDDWQIYYADGGIRADIRYGIELREIGE